MSYETNAHLLWEVREGSQHVPVLLGSVHARIATADRQVLPAVVKDNRLHSRQAQSHHTSVCLKFETGPADKLTLIA